MPPQNLYRRLAVLLDWNFLYQQAQANRAWVSDITYLPLANGNWVYYCCAFQDVCSKQVMDWLVRADMSEALVTTALQRALLAQRPAPGLIVHSDRGGQYVGNNYKTLLRNAKAQLSHSRRGECYDNAQTENRLQVLGASGRTSKRSYSKPVNGPFYRPDRRAN